MALRQAAGVRRRAPGVLAKALAHAAALAPLVHLAWQVVDVARTGSNALGADPVVEIEHRLGTWALRLLLATLAVTPLRQLTGVTALLQFRRMLGLYAFTYASLHLLAYLVLNLFGAGTLAVVAAVDGDVGFLLLEGVWATVSAFSIVRCVIARRQGRKGG